MFCSRYNNNNNNNNNNNSLEVQCETFIIDHVIKRLEQKKRDLKMWNMVSYEEWISSMELEPVRKWLDNLPSRNMQSMMKRVTETLREARQRDILACFFTMLINKDTREVVVPEYMKNDEVNRLYLLQLISLLDQNNNNNIEYLSFDCYQGGRTFYMSDRERSLIEQVLRRSVRLKELTLQGFATDFSLQTLAESCSDLEHLDVSCNSLLNHISVLCLTGAVKVVKKGDLVRTFAQKESLCLFRESLKSLDLHHTSVVSESVVTVERCFPNLAVLRSRFKSYCRRNVLANAFLDLKLY